MMKAVKRSPDLIFPPRNPEFDIPVSDDFVTDHEECIFFDTPLDLTQVDYVQYGEYKIPVVME